MKERNSQIADSTAPKAWQCEHFLFCHHLGVVVINQQTTKLRPKISAVLQLLCEQAPKVINKLDILEAVWTNQEISDTAVADAIRTIRATLKKANNKQLIETVHRRGYRIRTNLKAIDLATFETLKKKQITKTKFHQLQLFSACLLVLLLTSQLFFKTTNKQQQAINNIQKRALVLYERYNLEGNQKAIDLLTEGLKSHPDSAVLNALLADAYSQNADRYYQNDNSWQDLAIKTAQNAVQNQPDYAPAWKALGLAQAISGQITKAIEAYKTASDLQPDYFAAIHNWAHLERIKGNITRALELFEEIIHLKSSDPYIYFSVAHCFRDLDLFDVANKWYRHGLSLKPELLSDQQDYHLNLLYEQNFSELNLALQQLNRISPYYNHYFQLLIDQQNNHSNVDWNFTEEEFKQILQESFGVDFILSMAVQEPELESITNIINSLFQSYERQIKNYRQSPTVLYQYAQLNLLVKDLQTAIYWLDEATQQGWRNHHHLMMHSVFKNHLKNQQIQQIIDKVQSLKSTEVKNLELERWDNFDFGKQ